ncbi:MAG: hypothetical protein OXC19_25090 [Bryobacterales bacterium]|nr:hypothetical protein [Bryobacterales bacterium]
MEKDQFTVDSMYVVVPRAAGIDVHKMQVTATVRRRRQRGYHHEALRD